MDTILTWMGVVVVPLYLASLIGGPMFLMDWVRNRRQQTVRLQIALTDAIDAELGAIVSPVVKKPLWGPWQVHIAAPLVRPAVAGKILALAQQVLSAAGRMTPDRYEIIFTPMQGSIPEETTHRASHSTQRWPRESRLAA